MKRQLLAPVGAPVVVTPVATVALANSPPGGGVNYCEWDPDLYEWVCYPTATPTPTPTPTPTDTPRPSTPSGTLSAAKSVIDVDETVTVSAVNVSPSGQNVYIQTSGPLGYASQGSCHVGINPGASVAARSWTLIGCSPPGNGSVTLKTRHNGSTLSLHTITLDVQAGPTATPTPTPTPVPTPSGGLSAAKSVIDVDETVIVSAVNVTPSGQSVYITTSGPLGYSKHGSCHVGIDPGASVAARSWTLIGCTPPGNGSVTLKTLHAGKTLSLATITIDVQAAATATPTPTPPTLAPTPSGGLSATKSVIDVGDTVTVSADNVSPSGQQVYITTSGPLGFAGQSPCTSGTSAVARSWSLVGCSPPGSGSVTLKTSHNGQTLSLATIAITVQATATPTPLDKPPPPGDFKAAAPIGNTGRVTLTWDRLVGADKYEVQYRLSGGAQGQSAGNWIRHDDNITGPGPTITHNVDGLTCDQSRDFRVRSYGNAALYLGEWGDDWSPILSRTPPCPPTPTPTPTVLPAPSITGHTQVAYRWLNITWTGHRDYGNRYSVQRSSQSVTGWTKWKTLPNAATAHDRERAIIAGHTADLRGLPTSPAFNKIKVRVVGRTADGRSATSAAREIERVKPDAKGHQHDRDVNYNLSKSLTGTPGVWFREAAPRAASAWAWAATATATYLSVSTGSSGNAVTIRLYNENDSDDKGCRDVSETACVYFFDKPDNVDHHLRNMAMIFYPSPVYEDEKGKRHFYRWTNDKSRNMKFARDEKTRFLWVGGALIHEFGHTFGLKHPAEDADLTGIMHTPNVMLPSKKYENGLTTIQPVDVAAIKFIYHGHIKNEGW